MIDRHRDKRFSKNKDSMKNLLPIMRRYVNRICISYTKKSHDVLLLANGIIRKDGRRISMNFIQFFDVTFNMLYTFFSKGIWIVLFFFFLNKLYENQKLMATSRVITAVLLGLYLLYIILGPLFYFQ